MPLLLLRRLGILAVTIVLAPAFTYVVFTTLRADSFTPGETLSGLWDWMSAFLLHGDLGYDEDFDLPLTQVLLDGLPVDLVMMAGGLAFGLGVGALCGLVAVARPRTRLTRTFDLLAGLGVSMPVYWMGFAVLCGSRAWWSARRSRPASTG